jgi:hypothetical protein
MDSLKWELLTEVYGSLEADMLKSFLEAEGIPVQLFQEGAGRDIYPVNIGPLAMVQVFVPKERIDDARILLESIESGDENTPETNSDSINVD